MTVSKSLKKTIFVILSTFAVFVVALVYSFRLAQKSFEPITDDKYYVKGLDYQKIIDQDKAGKSQGWQVKTNLFELDMVAKSSQHVSVQLMNSKNLEVQSASIFLQVERPASVKERRKINLRKDNSSCQNAPKNCKASFSGELIVPQSGYWEIFVFAEINKNVRAYRSKKIFVK